MYAKEHQIKRLRSDMPQCRTWLLSCVGGIFQEDGDFKLYLDGWMYNCIVSVFALSSWGNEGTHIDKREAYKCEQSSSW